MRGKERALRGIGGGCGDNVILGYFEVGLGWLTTSGTVGALNLAFCIWHR